MNLKKEAIKIKEVIIAILIILLMLSLICIISEIQIRTAEAETEAEITTLKKEITELKSETSATTAAAPKPSTAQTTTATIPIGKAISDDELMLIASIVMNEAGCGNDEGIIAVTQCFKNAMEKEGKNASYIKEAYGYTKSKEPSQAVVSLVYAVFYDGLKVTDEPILYFYAPALCRSEWHESKTYVCEYGGNKFFKE